MWTRAKQVNLLFLTQRSLLSMSNRANNQGDKGPRYKSIRSFRQTCYKGPGVQRVKGPGDHVTRDQASMLQGTRDQGYKSRLRNLRVKLETQGGDGTSCLKGPFASSLLVCVVTRWAHVYNSVRSERSQHKSKSVKVCKVCRYKV